MDPESCLDDLLERLGTKPNNAESPERPPVKESEARHPILIADLVDHLKTATNDLEQHADDLNDHIVEFYDWHAAVLRALNRYRTAQKLAAINLKE